MKKRDSLTTELSSMRASGAIWSNFPNSEIEALKIGKTYSALRELKNDPHLYSCVQSRKSGSIMLEWKTLPNNAEKSSIELIEKSLASIDILAFIRDILEAPLFGFQPLEIIWEQDNESYFAKSIRPKLQEDFLFTNSGELRFRTLDAAAGGEIPELKILCPRYEATQYNQYGASLLAKCFWLVKFKNGTSKLWAECCEKYGLPSLVGKVNRNATMNEANEIADSLAAMGANTAIVVPHDIELEFKEHNRLGSNELFQSFIQHCNSEISKAILSQTLTTELGSSGSYAAAATHFKVRREIILSDAKLIERTFNELFKYILKANGIEGSAPMFSLILNDSDNSQRIERDKIIMQYGSVKFSKDYWIRNYGFKEEDFLNQD